MAKRRGEEPPEGRLTPEALLSVREIDDFSWFDRVYNSNGMAASFWGGKGKKKKSRFERYIKEGRKEPSNCKFMEICYGTNFSRNNSHCRDLTYKAELFRMKLITLVGKVQATFLALVMCSIIRTHANVKVSFRYRIKAQIIRYLLAYPMRSVNVCLFHET